MIPKDISGIVYLNFDNLDGNHLGKTSVPIVVNRIISQNTTIPDWIKNNAGWWSDEQIDDNTFIQGIEYMIKNKIISIPQTQQKTSTSEEIPTWIKNNAGWWADGVIDDETFVQGLEFLIQKGIIHV